MAEMTGSFEERQSKLREALTSLLLPDADYDIPGGGWVCVEATFPDTVYCTVNTDGDSDSYQIDYSFGPDGEVSLGMPQPVTLSVVATPGGDDDSGDDSDDDGGDDIDGDEVDPDDAATVRFLTPAADSLATALSYVMAAPSGVQGKAFEPVRTQMLRLIDGLAVKGLTLDGLAGKAAGPVGGTVDPTPANPDETESGDNGSDDEDPWASLLDDTDSSDEVPGNADTADLADSEADNENGPDSSDDTVDDTSADDDGNDTSSTDDGGADNSDDSDDSDGGDTVSLDPDQVKADLASIRDKGSNDE